MLARTGDGFEAGDLDGMEASYICKGVCQTVEKEYFRLNTAPDPQVVRPPDVTAPPNQSQSITQRLRLDPTRSNPTLHPPSPMRNSNTLSRFRTLALGSNIPRCSALVQVLAKALKHVQQMWKTDAKTYGEGERHCLSLHFCCHSTED